MHRYTLRCIHNLIVPYCILFSSSTLKFTVSLSKIASDVAYLIMEFCHLTLSELKVSADVQRKQHAEVNINFICRPHSWGIKKSTWQARAHWQNKNKEPAISQTKLFCSFLVRVLLWKQYGCKLVPVNGHFLSKFWIYTSRDRVGVWVRLGKNVWSMEGCPGKWGKGSSRNILAGFFTAGGSQRHSMQKEKF